MIPPKMTDLDRKLQEMAVMNWPQFVQMVGADALVKAKVCMLRQNKSSYGEIAIKLDITERQARYACDNCSDTKKAG